MLSFLFVSCEFLPLIDDILSIIVEENYYDETIDKEIENNVFYFKGESGNEYINELDNDDGMFYKDWLKKKEIENPTEATE